MSHNNPQIEGQETADENSPPFDQVPAAGPHAKPELTDNSKTPGASALPDNSEQGVDPGAG